MVHPILEYGNIIWEPYYLIDQRKVETIQHTAIKLVTRLQEKDYGTRLTELRLPLLYYCRQHGDMIFLYQIFNSLVDIDVNDLLTKSTGINRGHKLKIYKCYCSCLP